MKLQQNLTSLIFLITALTTTFKIKSANSLDFSNHDCHQCLSKGGQQCLDDNDFTEASCCDQSVPYSQQSSQCQQQKNSQFCASSKTIKNSILKDFVCPAVDYGCPDQLNQQIVHNQWNLLVQRDFKWFGTVPDPSYNFKCKYLIKADASIIKSTNSYIMLEIETYGFDGDVFIITQLHGKFQDYTNDQSSPFTKIYSVYFGTTFYVPSQYDILIYFQPVKSSNKIVSKEGQISVKTQLLQKVQDSYSKNFNPITVPVPTNDQIANVLQNLQKQNISNNDQNKNQTNTTSAEYLDSSPENSTVKKDWYGNVQEQGPWQNKTLFYMNGYRITYQSAVVSAAAVVGVIIAALSIIFGIMCWKKQQVEEVARKMSGKLKMAINQLSNQKYFNDEELQKENYAPVDPAKVTLENNQQDILNDLFYDKKMLVGSNNDKTEQSIQKEGEIQLKKI